MNVSELIEKTGWERKTSGDNEVTGVYCGDLLSWVMGRGEPGQAWITVQIHRNIVAVASLREFSCIVIADGAEIPDDILEKAEEENIPVLAANKPVFDLAKQMVELGF